LGLREAFLDLQQSIAQHLSALIGAAAGCVVVGGGLFAVLKAREGAQTASRWARGVCGIWSGLEDSGAWLAPRAQHALQNWYGIGDRGALAQQVEALLTTSGWDLVRAVDLLRMGLAAGYLDADECSERTRQVAEFIRLHFNSWQALADDFEAGMHAWQDQRGVTDVKERTRVQRNVAVLKPRVWSKVRLSATWE
jgi:hypothetical protein